jgi:cytochrome c biogenesis protein CcmG, thiol:disulfide interchange protein DsbE
MIMHRPRRADHPPTEVRIQYVIKRPSKTALLNIAMGTVAAVAVALAVAYALAPEATKVKVGEQAPELELPTFGGSRSRLSSYRGQPVLLFFFKATCRLCREEMPALEELHRRYGPRGLTVLGVSVDVDNDTLKSFLEQHNVTFIIMQDPDAQVLRREFGSYKMPESYLLDKNGVVVRTYLGRADWQAQATLEPIQRLIGIRMWPH